MIRGGRIVLPPMLRSLGRIEDLALFVGQGRFVELWNPRIAIEAGGEMLKQIATFYLEQTGSQGMNAAAAPAADPHVPVLLDEVVDALAPAPGETHVDGTFGAGGYTKALLAKGAARVFAFDRDPEAIQYGETLAASSGGRLTLVPDRFSRMRQALAARGVDAGRRRDARYRRLLDAIGPGRARLLLPGRRAARHAHGQGGAERRRLPQRRRRSRDRRRPLPLWRGAQVAPGRAGDRRGAADRADRPARRHRPQGARPS